MADYMSQTDHRGSDWSGPISDVVLAGLDTWTAKWTDQKNNNVVHTLRVTVNETAGTMDIFEMQPEQHWVGTYRKTEAGVYLTAGHLANGAADRVFSAVITLPQA